MQLDIYRWPENCRLISTYPMVIAVNTTNKAEISLMKTKTVVCICLTYLI
jgi:hypothetical protein